MPVIKSLPSPEIIRGLRGVLDFYVWRGLNCVRKWPRTPPSHRTAKSMAAAALFGAVVQSYALLGGALKTLYAEAAADQPRTGRDLHVAATLGHLHELNMDEIIALLEQQLAILEVLVDLNNALNDVGTDELRVLPAHTGGAWKAPLVDEEGHLQVDILDLPDPFDVANLRSAALVQFGTQLVGVKSSLTKHFTLMGVKSTGIIDNTLFDIMEFQCPDEPHAGAHGLCGGWLTVLVRNRHTWGRFQSMSRVYRISILAEIIAGTLILHQTIIDTDESTTHPITLSLSPTGGTRSYIKLQLKFTHDFWDPANPTAAWQFVGYSHARGATGFLTPSVC